MPATRHTRRTSAAPYKPYGPYPLPAGYFMLQASILQNIQQITDFTYQDDVKMTPANLMVAIRLIVKCDMTLENIESALDIAAPGSSKYQYYRAVFLDYQDIILDQKRALNMTTNVPDEVRQQALNLLDDSIPEAPSDSPPYSPSSPIYSPVCTSPIMEYPDYASEITSDPATTSSDDENDEPLVE
jgi:hypothetical protein